jgi:hypothetical protein
LGNGTIEEISAAPVEDGNTVPLRKRRHVLIAASAPQEIQRIEDQARQIRAETSAVRRYTSDRH